MTVKIAPIGHDAEVLGGAINGFIAAVNRDNILPHLEKLGMLNLDSAAWYPKQLYIDLWNEILSNNQSSMLDLVSIGMTIAQTAWPPEADGQPVEDLIIAWGDAFDMVNRGEDRGYVRTQKRSQKQYAVLCRTPDPDDLHYGIVYGFCRRFMPENQRYTVAYDKSVTRRDHGGEETVIFINLD